MLITIHYKELESSISKLFIEDKLSHFVIDFEPNALFARDGRKELEIFNFNRICKLDNRYSSYEIFIGPTEILIDFKTS
jgi:hypothetical protein|tara:strand:+ start:500 stop:736 length:237 start_codon:yes stop_codon:yes gene_type:complete